MSDISALLAYTGQLAEAAVKSGAASIKQHEYINGNDQTDVLTESGFVPTIAKQARLSAEETAGLRGEMKSKDGLNLLAMNRAPIAMAIGSAAKAIAGLSVSIWEYDHLVEVRPTPLDPTSWDWTPALRAAINSADGVRHLNINVPMPIRVGNIKITGKANWSLNGGGTLRKITPNSMMELYECPGVRIHNVGLDGNIIWDEDVNGSIIPARPGAQRTAYACGVYAQQCADIRIFDCDIYDFANDPISIRGKYTGGVPGTAGATLVTASVGVLVTNCNIYNYRNTAVYLAGVKAATVARNKIYTTDDFGYIRGNGVYIVDWCDGVLCFDNSMDRIGDNGIGVGEVKNPAAQNKNVSLISNFIDRSVYMSILVAGGEDVLVYDNTLIRGMMQKALLPEAFLISGNPGSLQVRGGNISKANRIRLIANNVDQSYQRGIYVFDDAGITKDNWSEGIEIASNIVRRSLQENIYVNMANTVVVAFNQASLGESIGIFASGAHDLFMNRAWGNANHGILSSQLNTFPGQPQNPTIAHNRGWENGLNGIQVLGGALTRANPPTPEILHNKCWRNGFAGTTLGGKAGLRANGVYHPTILGNEIYDNFGPGLLIESCTSYVAEGSNKLRNNGWDVTLPQIQRAGIYVLCTAATFKEGRLMSNKMFAGDYQQVGYAAEFDTSGSLICIGNEADSHPLLPQNVARKSWLDIYSNR